MHVSSLESKSFTLPGRCFFVGLVGAPMWVLSMLVGCRPPVAAADAPTSGFVEVDHPNGQSWLWNTNPSLQVLFVPEVQDGWAAGVYVLWEKALLGTWSERPWRGDHGWLPLVIGTPRSDGTELVISTDPDLVLALAGSPEHGCPLDDLMVRLRPKMRRGQVQVVFEIDGVPYLAFPRLGQGVVVDASGRTSFELSDMELNHEMRFYGFRSLTVTESPLGTLEIRSDPAVPDFQLQVHEGFIEGDLDHSCEDGDFAGTHLRVTVRDWKTGRGLPDAVQPADESMAD